MGKARRNAADLDEESGLERKPLQFSIDDDPDGLEQQSGAPPAPPPIFRNIRDTHPPPTYTQVIINRILLTYFPRLLIFMFIAFFIIALLPGGWKVALCASNLLPPPSLTLENENITVVGHRGSEFPYPENSMQAIEAALKTTHFIEFDVALTSDHAVILMHDIAYDKTTINGTGLTCMSPLSYAESLILSTPERNPQGHMQQGKFCVRNRRNGGVGTVPCSYKIPTLASVFENVPFDVKFMIDIKQCYAPDIQVSAALCSNCTTLMNQIKDLMDHHFINPKRVVFTSSEQASLSVFQKNMNPNSSFALSMEPLKYSHFKPSAVLKLLDDYKFDAVSMHVTLAAMRPDLVHAIKNSKVSGRSENRQIFAWTARRNFDFKLARCAGVPKIIAAEPEKIWKFILWEEFGAVLATQM